ncbi:2-dehydro-3-deoxygluconokinase [Planctomycetota bacterium]|nr:2-dehydro-3-deoxygluconokinase [Planctomycetota bacterium]
MPITLRSAASCRFDQVSLGEVMLRLDPGQRRIHTARQFDVWEGGGEYNVARGLRRCFGLRTAIVTAVVDNPVGRLLEDLMLQGGVDLSYLKWVPFDGIGRASRNALNFTEAGYGVRGAVGCSDRAHSATGQLKRGDIDWDRLFGKEGSRWFHCGGIFAALSATTPEVALEAMQAAKRHGVVVSYDLNYRPSLWKSIGGQAKAQEVNKELAKYVDVMIGNEEDFTASLGFHVAGTDANLSALDPASFRAMIGEVVRAYPNFSAVATTLREVHHASENGWSAVLWHDGAFYQAPTRDLWVLDRVGGGDSFASGLVYGFLAGLGPQAAVDYGAAHGALAMTTPGDTSMATKAEVDALVKGGGARVQR